MLIGGDFFGSNKKTRTGIAMKYSKQQQIRKHFVVLLVHQMGFVKEKVWKIPS